MFKVGDRVKVKGKDDLYFLGNDLAGEIGIVKKPPDHISPDRCIVLFDKDEAIRRPTDFTQIAHIAEVELAPPLHFKYNI